MINLQCSRTVSRGQTFSSITWNCEFACAGKTADQVYFLYTMRNYSIEKLCTKFRMSSERVSAIIQLKQTEPEMIATDRYSTKVDEALNELYTRKPNADKKPWKPDFDMGINYVILKDDQIPDDVVPVVRKTGTVLRRGVSLPVIAQPARSDRIHASKFAIRDISGRKNNKVPNPHVSIGDWDGSVRPATNVEALYRSWEVRYWNASKVKSKSGLPFTDEDANKPAHFRVTP
jgi:hypothetical protein